MDDIYRAAFLIVLTIASTSKARSDTEYPSRWPKPIQGTSDGCVTLSGRYSYRGEPDRPDRGGAPTIDRAAFNRMSVRGYPQTATFEHEVKTGVLNVHIEGRDISPPDRASFSRQLKCEGGWWVYSLQFGDCQGAAVTPRSCSRVRLLYTRTEDRSLIVHFTGSKDSESSVGDVKKTSVDAWYRFGLVP